MAGLLQDCQFDYVTKDTISGDLMCFLINTLRLWYFLIVMSQCMFVVKYILLLCHVNQQQQYLLLLIQVNRQKV